MRRLGQRKQMQSSEELSEPMDEGCSGCSDNLDGSISTNLGDAIGVEMSASGDPTSSSSSKASASVTTSSTSSGFVSENSSSLSDVAQLESTNRPSGGESLNSNDQTAKIDVADQDGGDDEIEEWHDAHDHLGDGPAEGPDVGTKREVKDSLTAPSIATSESTPSASSTGSTIGAAIGDDFLVFRKAQKRSFVKAPSESSSAELKPKKTSVTSIVDYSSSSSSSSSTSSLDSDDDSDGNDDNDPNSDKKGIDTSAKTVFGDEEEERDERRTSVRDRRRIRRRPVVIDDDSDEDDDGAAAPGLADEDDDVAGARDDSDDDDDVDEAPANENEAEEEDEGELPIGPKPNWFSLNSLREREYGGKAWNVRKFRRGGGSNDETRSNNCNLAKLYNSTIVRGAMGFRGDFIYRTCGALCWVQRFDLTCRLDQHQGCVNSLHFNESG